MASKRPDISKQPEPEVQQPPKPVGRPRKYATPEQMQAAIDEYFDTEEEPTVTGLALHLGFTTRDALYSYHGYGTEFSDIVKRARLRVECRYEKNLSHKGLHAAGSIFALKNMGWKDSQSVAIETLPPIQVMFNSDGPACVPHDAEPKAD